MKPRTLYLVLCIAGLLLPYWQFVPWVMQHGLNLSLFVRELFASRIGAFFGMDVIVSAVTLLVFTRIESTRLRMHRRWMVAVAVLTVGVSLGLPLFLYMRESELEGKADLVEATTGAKALQLSDTSYAALKGPLFHHILGSGLL